MQYFSAMERVGNFNVAEGLKSGFFFAYALLLMTQVNLHVPTSESGIVCEH